ncbi:MAG: DUF1343 domain-containing protein [Ekhidna sp.]|nr:DUF1343 domain-containing protein [Ekhidna sp.]
MNMRTLTFILLLISLSCSNQAPKYESSIILPGAYQTTEYLPLLQNKSVGLTINHSSLIENTHLTDTLLKLGIEVNKVYTPEHGFSGTASDGELIEYDSLRSTFELISLYGKNKKPKPDQLKGIDLMVFDMQDVGTRFYTYISTMHYVMEACAENDIPLLILDRPNPNGSYVDGPVLDTVFQSFVGMHPIPIVHGMTIGELAQMINDEGWLKNEIKVDLTVIKMKNWDHEKPYSLPVKPSPNLPDDLSISLYPSLCLFEGTIMSVGRGTDYAFQHIGHPDFPDTTYSFIPRSKEGAKWPPLKDQRCYGRSWRNTTATYRFSLEPLITIYREMNDPDFFNDYFKRLAGNDLLEQQIKSGMTEKEIRETWNTDLEAFKKKRANYLLYN